MNDLTLKVDVNFSNAFIESLKSSGSQLEAFSKSLKKVENESTKTETALERLEKRFNTIQNILLGFLSSQAFIKPIEVASSYIESLNRLSISFKNYNEAISTVKELSNTLGLSKKSVVEFLTTYKTMLVGLGLTDEKANELSKSFVKLTADISSYYNIPIDEASQKIQSALTGEFQALKSLGVVITENMIKQKMLEMGLKDYNDTSQRTQAIVSLLQEKFSNVSGDMERTKNSFSNTLRRISETTTNILGVIGQAIIETIQPIIQGIDIVLKWIDTFLSEVLPKSKFLQTLTIGLLLLGTAFITLGFSIKKALIVSGVGTVLILVLNIVMYVLENIQMINKQIKNIGTGLVSFFVNLWNAVVNISEIIKQVFVMVVEVVKAIFYNAFQEIKGFFVSILNAIIEGLNFVLEKVGVKKLEKIVVDVETKNIGQIISQSKKEMEKSWDGFKKHITKGWDGLKEVGKGIGKIVGGFIFDAGKQTIEELQQSSYGLDSLQGGKGGSSEQKPLEKVYIGMLNFLNQFQNIFQKDFWDKILTVIDKSLINANKSIDKVMAGFLGISTGMIDWIGVAIQFLTAFIGKLSELSPSLKALLDVFNFFIDVLANALAPLIEKVLKPIVVVVQSFVNVLVAIIVAVLTPILQALSEVMEFLAPILMAFVDVINQLAPIIAVLFQIVAQITKLISPVIPILKAVFDVLVFIINKIVIPIFNFVVKIINTIIGIIEGAINGIIRFINGIIDTINNVLGWTGLRLGRMSEVGFGRFSELSEITPSTPSNQDTNINTNIPTTGTTTSTTTSSSGVSVRQQAPIYIYMTNNGVIATGFRTEDDFIKWIKEGIEKIGNRGY